VVAVTVAVVPSHIDGEFTSAVVRASTVTVVMQVVKFPHSSSTVQVIVDTPGSNFPLASFPVPVLSVTPVIWKVMVKISLQLSVASSEGIVYLSLGTSQKEMLSRQLEIIGEVLSSIVTV
jgi:hypothetical protein